MKKTCVVFRADAGLDIGTGHVIRCLTLADALRDRGVDTLFITRDIPGHVIPTIFGRGHRVEVLTSNTDCSYGAHPAKPHHASWLQAGWREDAVATHAVLESESAGMLVMDHYALDREWQRMAIPSGTLLMVVDDLADRPHAADLLLDQNVGRQADHYDGLLPINCTRFIGPAHALLRPEFARLRSKALMRRGNLNKPETLLVTLGGIDKNNATVKVLDALARSPAAMELQIKVVMGVNAPWLDDVKSRATKMPIPTEIAINAPDMADRMTQADLCIGAAGATALERCALGLPTLQVALAENQQLSAIQMDKQGLVRALPFPEAPDFYSALDAGLEYLVNSDNYCDMAQAAAAITDGSGARRLAMHLLEKLNAQS